MSFEQSDLKLIIKDDSIHLLGLSREALDAIEKLGSKVWRMERKDIGIVLRKEKEIDLEAKENALPTKIIKKESPAASQPMEIDDGEVSAQFSQILCSSPRGRYDLLFGAKSLIFKGKTNSFSVEFSQMESFFVISPTSAQLTNVIICSNTPIKIGKTSVDNVVWELSNKDKTSVKYNNNKTDETEVFTGSSTEVFMKVVAKFPAIKVLKPLSIFRTKQISGANCTYKFSSGGLFATQKGILFGPKPAIFIPFEQVKDMKFPRFDEPSKTFDCEIKTEAGKKITFDNLDKENGKTFVNFINTMDKKEQPSTSPVKQNIEASASTSRRPKRAPAVHYKTAENMDSDSDDDDYNYQSENRSHKKPKSDEPGSDSDSDAPVVNVSVDSTALVNLDGDESLNEGDADEEMSEDCSDESASDESGEESGEGESEDSD